MIAVAAADDACLIRSEFSSDRLPLDRSLRDLR